MEIFTNARFSSKNGHKIAKLLRYAVVPYYAFKINYHTVSSEGYYILVGYCSYRIYNKSNTVKLRNFIGLELVVNKIMIYE